MIWKYSHCVAECRCKEDPKWINFITLIPVDNRTTKKDYDLIDKIGDKLKKFGFNFWGGTVMLISHKNYTKKEIENILKDELIIIR
jgi:hypothetical protein